MEKPKLIPHVRIEYFEFDKRIDKPVELSSDCIIVDSFFFPSSLNRFSLGYQVSLNRTEETIQCLKSFGLNN
jgi:hypothetical protein